MASGDFDAEHEYGGWGGGDPAVDAAENEMGAMGGAPSEQGGEGTQAGFMGNTFPDLSFSYPTEKVDLEQAQQRALELAKELAATGGKNTAQGMLGVIGNALSVPAMGLFNALGLYDSAKANAGRISTGVSELSRAKDLFEAAGYGLSDVSAGAGRVDPETGEPNGGEGYATFTNPTTGDVIRLSISAEQAAELQPNINYDTSTPGGLSQLFLDRYRNTYIPLQDNIINQAQSKEIPGLAAMLANIDKYYSDVAANKRRTMGGLYQYGGGLPQNAQLTTELNRARAKSGTSAQMTADAAQKRFSNMLAAAGMGSNLPGLAAQGTQSQLAFNTDSDRYKDQANANLWGSLATGAGNLARMIFGDTNNATPTGDTVGLLNRAQPQPETTPAPSPGGTTSLPDGTIIGDQWI